MKTLQESRYGFTDYLQQLKADGTLSNGQYINLKFSAMQWADKSFEAGQSAANKAHEQTQEFLNKKI